MRSIFPSFCRLVKSGVRLLQGAPSDAERARGAGVGELVRSAQQRCDHLRRRVERSIDLALIFAAGLGHVGLAAT